MAWIITSKLRASWGLMFSISCECSSDLPFKSLNTGVCTVCNKILYIISLVTPYTGSYVCITITVGIITGLTLGRRDLYGGDGGGSGVRTPPWAPQSPFFR